MSRRHLLVPAAFYFHPLLLDDVRRGPKNVGEDAGGGDLCSGSWALDDERRFLVAIRKEGDDIVVAVERVEWMIFIYCAERHRRLPLIQSRNVAENFAFLCGCEALLLKGGVVFLQDLEEFLYRLCSRSAPAEKALDLDVFQLEREPGLSREYQYLPRHIEAGEVVARIRLGIAEALCLAHGLAKRLLAFEIIENVAERAGEYGLYLDDTVAAEEQIAQRRDDRQSRSDIGLVEEFGPMLYGDILQFLIEG